MSSYNRHRRGKKHKTKRKYKHSSTKQRSQRPIPVRGPSYCNCHHILWMRRVWSHGYAKALREHPYCKIYIPAHTLHAYIHEQMSEISLPPESYCAEAYKKINFLYQQGIISDKDAIDKRIVVIIDAFDISCKNTRGDLARQLSIVKRWYEASKQDDKAAT